MKNQGINLEKVKSSNRSTILRLLFKMGPMSRKDIATAVGLTPASVTIICAELIEEGVLIERGEVEEAKRAGRKKILVDINPNYKYVLCAAIEVEETYLSITNLKGEMISQKVIETDSHVPPEEFLGRVASGFKHLMWDSYLSRNQILSAAVSIPGYVKAGDERYVKTAKIWKEDVPLKELLEEELDLPVVIDNNLRAYAKAELIFGNGRERDNLLIVKWGPGVGAAIISNNAIYEGSYGIAAEIGQMRPSSSKAEHLKGHIVTLEDAVSTHAIINSVLKTYGETEESHKTMPVFEQWLLDDNKISYKNTAVWGSLEDETLQGVIDEKIMDLVYAVVNASIVIDPDKIVVIGYLFDVPGFYERFVEKYLMLRPEKDNSFITKSTLKLRQNHTESLAIVIDKGIIQE